MRTKTGKRWRRETDSEAKMTTRRMWAPGGEQGKEGEQGMEEPVVRVRGWGRMTEGGMRGMGGMVLVVILL
jgi:hypothetical protein